MSNQYLKPITLSGDLNTSSTQMAAVNTAGGAFIFLVVGVAVMIMLSGSDKDQKKESKW